MDPVSILSIAGSAASLSKLAWHVGEGLYTFFGDVKVIDSTVSGLVSEVKALGNACALVDDRLRDIVRDFDREVRRPVTDRNKLWNCIKMQISECEESVTQLQVAFENVRREGSNSLAQMWRQVKLNMKAKDVSEARNRIRSHTASLQTILQTVAIEICYLAPQRADQQLRTLLGGMEECMEHLKALRQERSEPDSSKHAIEEDIISICEQAVNNGESLYAASMANGSLLGDPASGAKVREWMKDISAIDEVISRPLFTDVDARSVISSGDVVSNGMSDDTTAKESFSAASPSENLDKVLTASCALDETELDSDDEFLAEMTQEALDVARSSFDAKEYEEASAYLQEALKLVRELPAKRQQSICNTWQLRYMLAICAFHNQEPAEAEADLINVLDNASRAPSTNNEHLRQVCEVGHLLSLVCIKLGKLDQARLYCDNSLQGRRRILGKDHEEYYQSLSLTARILQLQGNDLRATIYLRKVPDDVRESFAATFGKVSLPEELPGTVDQAQSPRVKDGSVMLQNPKEFSNGARKDAASSAVPLALLDTSSSTSLNQETVNAEDAVSPSLTKDEVYAIPFSAMEQLGKEIELHTDELPKIRFTSLDMDSTEPISFQFEPIVTTLAASDTVIRVVRDSKGLVKGPAISYVEFKVNVVSRQHCQFWCADGHWYLQDTKSTCGTFLNSVRLAEPGQESRPHRIANGDVVQLGIASQDRDGNWHPRIYFRVDCTAGGSPTFVGKPGSTHERACSAEDSDPAVNAIAKTSQAHMDLVDGASEAPIADDFELQQVDDEEFAVLHTTFGDIVLGASVNMTGTAADQSQRPSQNTDNKKWFLDFLKDINKKGMHDITLRNWMLTKGEALYKMNDRSESCLLESMMCKDSAFVLSANGLSGVRGRSLLGQNRMNGWARVDTVDGLDVTKLLLGQSVSLLSRKIKDGRIVNAEVVKAGHKTQLMTYTSPKSAGQYRFTRISRDMGRTTKS